MPGLESLPIPTNEAWWWQHHFGLGKTNFLLVTSTSINDIGQHGDSFVKNKAKRVRFQNSKL